MLPVVDPELVIVDPTTTQAVTVLERTGEMPGFSGSPQALRERVIVSAQLARRLGIGQLRRQLLVQVGPTTLKLMTSRVTYGTDVDAIYIAREGLDEIAGEPGILDFPQTATVTSVVPFAMSREAAEAGLTLYQAGRSLTGTAPGLGAFVNGIHGGNIEVGSDLQADRCASRLESVHNRPGYVYTNAAWAAGTQSGNDRWHITAVDFLDHVFTKLPARSGAGYQAGVGFHGFVATEGQSDILIGGQAGTTERNALKTELDAALSGTGVTVATDEAGDHQDGDSDDNVTNRYVPGGDTYQLEQVFSVRNDETIRDTVADTVADFLHTQRLIA